MDINELPMQIHLCPGSQLERHGAKTSEVFRETHRDISRVLKYSSAYSLVYNLDFLDPLEYAV